MRMNRLYRLPCVVYRELAEECGDGEESGCGVLDQV